MIELVLPLPTPSMNRFYGRHWSKKARERKKWAWMVRAERLRLAKDGLMPNRIFSPLQVTIERYGPRICDHDNVVGGAKPLIDALVAEGFLIDDSPTHMTATYRQFIGKTHRTVVKIDC